MGYDYERDPNRVAVSWDDRNIDSTIDFDGDPCNDIQGDQRPDDIDWAELDLAVQYERLHEDELHTLDACSRSARGLECGVIVLAIVAMSGCVLLFGFETLRVCIYGD
jgi:hypothetical protein